MQCNNKPPWPVHFCVHSFFFSIKYLTDKNVTACLEQQPLHMKTRTSETMDELFQGSSSLCLTPDSSYLLCLFVFPFLYVALLADINLHAPAHDIAATSLILSASTRPRAANTLSQRACGTASQHPATLSSSLYVARCHGAVWFAASDSNFSVFFLHQSPAIFWGRGYFELWRFFFFFPSWLHEYIM